MRRRRWRSRNPRVSSRKKYILLVVFVFLLFSLQSFIFIEKNLKPPLMALAKVRLKQIATQAINKAISDRIAQGTDLDKLIQWKIDKDGKVSSFMFDYTEHMKITSDTINTVQSMLDNLKSTPEHIPVGQAMGSAILASFGPDVPIRLVPAGAVQVDLNTRHENAGINMVLVEVYMRIIAEVSIIIPFDSEPEIVETEVPISYLLVVGDTPMYYVDNKGNPLGGSNPLPPSVSLPELKKNASGGGSSSTDQGEVFGATGSSPGTGAASSGLNMGSGLQTGSGIGIGSGSGSGSSSGLSGSGNVFGK